MPPVALLSSAPVGSTAPPPPDTLRPPLPPAGAALRRAVHAGNGKEKRERRRQQRHRCCCFGASMSWGGGSGSGPGWGWWPPSRRRPPSSRRRPAVAGPGERGWVWALPAAAAAASLWLLVAALGLCGVAALSLLAAAAGGAWMACGAQKERRLFPRTPGRSGGGGGGGGGSSPLANGGAALAVSDFTARSRRRLGGDHLTLPADFVLSPRRRYPIHQAQYTSLGTLPSICWDGYRRKSRLLAHHSGMVQSPVMVKIARPDSRMGYSPLLEQLSSPAAFSPTPNSTLDPCAKETVLSALKQSRKRAVEEEEEEEDENRSFPSGLESKRRRHSSTGSGHSAFEPLMANGAPASLVSRPGSLKRVLLSHCLEDSSSKRSRTSSLSSVNSLYMGGIHSSFRNAIASSYSSTRGLSQLWKRGALSSSPLSNPASSHSQTPERLNKKAKYPDPSHTEEASHQSSISTPAKEDKEVQAEKAAEMPVTRHGSQGSPSPSGGSGKRKRKIQLLSSRCADGFALPPPPQLGYSVTSQDLDAEKNAALQWFNKVLEEKADSPPGLPAETTLAPTLSFQGIPTKSMMAPAPATSAGITNPLLESLKRMQSSPAQADSGVATDTPPPLAPTHSLDVGPSVPVTTLPEAKPPALLLGTPPPLAVPAPPLTNSVAQPATTTSSSLAVPSSSSELGQTPARPSSAPKPSSLFGMLTSPPAGQPAAAASSTPSPLPVFKPIFGSLPQSESSASSSGTPSTAAAPAPPGTGSSMAAPSVAPSGSFKPIFGDPPPPAAAPPATVAASVFVFKPSPPPLAALPASTAGFSILPKAIVTTAASLSSAAAMAVSASKPVFSFGLVAPSTTTTTAPNRASPTTAATAAATTSASQHFLFGPPPNAATSASNAAPTPLFQFGKPAAAISPALNPLASSAFSQAPSSAAEAAPSTAAPGTAATSIFGSGPGSTTQTPSATTQPPLTFGSSTSAFGGAFGAASKPPPPYPADAGQLTFDAGVPDGQQPAAKPAPGPVSFGTHFNFAGSVAQPAAQPAFGSATQTPFGGAAPLSFGTKSTTQPAFGATTSVFFGTATTSAAPGFGSNTQTTNSGTAGSVFGSSAPSLFSFGAASQPAPAGSAFGISGPAGARAPSGGFSFGGGGVGAATPFGASLAQTTLGGQNQSGSPFAFSIPGAPEGKPTFGGAPTPTFGQSSRAPGAGTGGGTLAFGGPITPAFGGAGPAFGSPTPAFSIGAGSKVGARQRLQARRQHTRKK
ncbi:nuclear envelope pore membrane protein POM 121 isoform X2 [Hemicordylus capensis]|uniref:nuclear envelope pore membrane protein POM 121 isoform X2 n=1 Tax=Hemicordylus capensis TaxID=884348 RepID=UPI002304B80A|nr:nuclear envelope pore membrane protein POM 121 isoform X2 [Hemicordylus capensis]